MELGQVVQVQLFVLGEKVAAHFELVGFAVVVGCPNSNWDDLSSLDCIC